MFLIGAVALALCHSMVTMATQIPSVIAPLRGEIVSHFTKVVVSADDDSQESKDLVVCVGNYFGVDCIAANQKSKSKKSKQTFTHKTMHGIFFTKSSHISYLFSFWLM